MVLSTIPLFSSYYSIHITVYLLCFCLHDSADHFGISYEVPCCSPIWVIPLKSSSSVWGLSGDESRFTIWLNIWSKKSAGDAPGPRDVPWLLEEDELESGWLPVVKILNASNFSIFHQYETFILNYHFEDIIKTPPIVSQRSQLSDTKYEITNHHKKRNLWTDPKQL